MFIYKIQYGASLTQSQEALLEKIENHPSPFHGIKDLNDLRSLTGTSVIISDRKSLISILKDSIRAIERKIDEFKGSRLISNPNVEVEIYDRKRWAEKQLEVAENPRLGETPLLGLYTRKLLWFDNSAPVVYLFADNIRDYAKRKSVKEDNVFAFVFAHEMMHAYYDAFNSDGFPCHERIEEAFAEFGMLSFLESFGQQDLFADARNEVSSEIQDGPREYGFGFVLFNMSRVNGIKMINRYKDISNWIDSSVVWTFPAQGSGNYFSDFSDYDKKWDATNADYCFKDIQIILNYPWQQPTINIQRHTNKAPFVPISNTQRRRFSPLVIYSPTQSIEQFCIVSDLDINNVIVTLIRLMKLFDFESDLSFAGPYVLYEGDRLFYYSSGTVIPDNRPSGAIGFSVIPESIRVNGVKVFPMLRPTWHTINKLVCILCGVTGETFSVVYVSDKYNLYGPDFGKEVNSIITHQFEYKKRYDVIIKATSEVLCQDESLSRIPFIVVKHFCESNKDVIWADLQRIFDKVEYRGPKFLDWITPKPIVDAFYASFPKSIPRFHKEPITLSSGDTLMVASSLSRPYRFDFESFIEVADSLGYEIRKHK